MQEIKNLKELGKIVGVNSMNKLLLEYMKVVTEKVNENDMHGTTKHSLFG